MVRAYKSGEILADLDKIGRLPVIPDTLREFELAWRDPHKGISKNLASLVFSVPNFSFWLKEGALSTSYMLFFATPSFRLPSHWVFRGALKYMAEQGRKDSEASSMLGMF
jgi:hypothetical protein